MNVMAFSHNELKWLKLTNNLSVTSWILWPSATMSCNEWRPQITSLWLHECYGLEPEWAVMAEGHSIWKVTEWLFVTRGCHSLLWLKVTTFEKWQRGNLWRKATTDCCGWRTQHLRNHKGFDSCKKWTVVAPSCKGDILLRLLLLVGIWGAPCKNVVSDMGLLPLIL